MENQTLKDDDLQSVEISPQKVIMSFKEALIYLDISKSSLYKLTSKRKITFLKPNEGKLYFKKEDLDDWLTSHEMKSTRVLQNENDNHLKTRKDGKKNY